MKLGYMMLMVAVGAMLIFAPVAMAAKGGDKAGKGHGDKNAVMGAVSKVDGNKITITTKDKGDKEIITNADTKVVTASKGADGKIEKKSAEMKDVIVGAHVAATLNADGTAATEIVIMPAHEKKAK